MAVPELRVKSTNELISNKCIGWDRWQDNYGESSVELLRGGYYVETIGARTYEGSATFRFDDSIPSSNLAKQDRLMDAAYYKEILTFLDFRGNIYDVIILGKPEKTPVENSRYREVNRVKVTLARDFIPA